MSTIKDLTGPLYQLRVAPKLPWPFSRMPVYFDSATLFITPEEAQAYTGEYIRGLVAAKILNPKRAYDLSIIALTVLSSPAEGLDTLRQREKGKRA